MKKLLRVDKSHTNYNSIDVQNVKLKGHTISSYHSYYTIDPLCQITYIILIKCDRSVATYNAWGSLYLDYFATLIKQYFARCLSYTCMSVSE